MQVKQTAAVQLWGRSVSRTLQFGWKSNPPSYFERDNPGEKIESEGWFCDGFVFGIQDETDVHLIDQVDPRQWTFMVVSVSDLKPRTNSMLLSKARTLWPTVRWEQLRGEVYARLSIR